MNYEPPPDPSEVEWKIEREGRAWDADEAMPRYELTPDKIELIRGKVFWSDEDRLRMLGLLLENCGADAAVRLGDPDVWRRAVAGLDDPKTSFRHALEAAHRCWDNGLNDAAAMLRFHERITTPDFAECATPGDPAPTTTREQLLASLARHGDEVDEATDVRDHPWADTKTDGFSLSSDTDATALVTRTIHRHRYEKADGEPGLRVRKVVEVERWRETWTRAEGDWRLRCRERTEGPWSVEEPRR